MENSLDKIFANDKNSVTLTLGDYESIKAVYDENKSLKEENEKLSESLRRVGRIFARAKVPEEVFEQLSEGKLEARSQIVQGNINDPLATTYVLMIEAHN